MKYSILIASALLVASLGQASAQSYELYSNRDLPHAAYMPGYSNGVAANGRCHGISYGTGARSCGTATGGPVGGYANRN